MILVDILITRFRFAPHFIRGGGLLTPASPTLRPVMLKYLNQVEATQMDVDLMGAEQGFSTDQLMELAGLSVAEAVVDAWAGEKQKVLVVCGPGNNGGDGLVAARHLFHMGYDVTVLYPKRKDLDLYNRLVRQLQQLEVRFVDTPYGQEYDILVDAIFGYSFNGEIRAPFDTLIPQLRQLEVPRICAVDVPSGWHVELGDVHNIEWYPHMLVSLTAPKLCATHFKGAHHYLGGRFVPPQLAAKYGIEGVKSLYKGSSQVARLDGINMLISKQ